LIDEYWKSHPNKKKAPRKSSEAKTPRRPRTSTVDEISDGGSAPVKKRNRKSQAKANSDMENGKNMDVDEIRTPKKPRKSAATKAQSRNIPHRQLIEEEEVHIGDMSQYMKTSSWEDLVLTVDTIEREAGDNLTVYFTLSVFATFYSSQNNIDI
jgi:chromobox protein 5